MGLSSSVCKKRVKHNSESTENTVQKKNKRGFFAIRDRFETVSDIQTALRSVGMECSQLIVAIDCTQSNTWTGARSFQGRCLHDVAIENPYQVSIRIIGDSLAPFDQDGLIPVMGFGDVHTADRSIFYFHPPDAPCVGFHAALEAYVNIIPQIKLSGPTSFAPVIRECIRKIQQRREYTILLILTDGCVTAVRETTNAIVEASQYPISIVCVGVGDGPFTQMEEFDDQLPERHFDNFQFVEFNKISQISNISDKNVAFAVMALQEIPDQYQQIVKLGLLG